MTATGLAGFGALRREARDPDATGPMDLEGQARVLDVGVVDADRAEPRAAPDAVANRLGAHVGAGATDAHVEATADRVVAHVELAVGPGAEQLEVARAADAPT